MSSSPRFIGAIVAGGVLVAGVSAVAILWRQPDRIGEEAYEYATALHSICDREDAQRLETFDQLLGEASESELISRQEFNVMDSIASLARRGKWEAARRKSRQLLEDQVERKKRP